MFKKNSPHKLNSLTTSNSSMILIFSLFLIILALLFFSFFARREFEKKLVSQLTHNAETVGKSISSVISKTYNYGIPIESMQGFNEFFNSYLDRNSEIEYIALYNSSDSLICYKKNSSNFAKNSTDRKKYFSTVNIKISNKTVASLQIGIAQKYVTNKISNITYDILTVMAISLLITFELLLFILAITITAPIDSLLTIIKNVTNFDFRKKIKINSKDEIGIFSESINKILLHINTSYTKIKNSQISKNSIHITKEKMHFIDPTLTKSFFKTLLIYFRPTLFLVVFAESLSISFFPIFVNTLYIPIFGLSKEMIMGLPISFFMFFWALSIPVGGVWSDRYGRGKLMAYGALLAAIGFALTVFAYNLYLLLIFRSITAVGYGIVYISSQGFIADNTTPKNRTAGMSSFVACFFSGALSGASIGGILVDRIGYNYTFMSASIIAFAGAFFAFKFVNSNVEKLNISEKKFRLSNFKMLFTNRRFLSILFFSSIPAKIALTGYLYFIAPTFLNSLGISNSSIGRFMITYGLSMVILSPWSGKMADRTGNRKLYVLAGGVLAGLSLLIPLMLPNTTGILLSILGLGIAHALGLSSQLTIAISLFDNMNEKIGSGSVIAIYRLIERIGNISGPIIAGILLSIFSYEKTATFIGIGIIIGSFLFIGSFLIFDIMDKKEI